MSIKPLLLLAILLPLCASAQQDWASMMENEQINFYEVQSEFKSHWENREVTKGKGYKQFKRWEYFMEQRVYPTGERFSPDAAEKGLKDYYKNNPQQKSLTGTWTYVGNTSIPTSGGGAGRINSVRMHPTNGNLYACAPAGGLWVSADNGGSWSTMTDALEHIGTSDLIIDHSDPMTMYLATGDGDGGDTYSIGVLKSTDGGVTWTASSLGWTYNQTRRISRLAMDPLDADILYAATSNGVYKTIDAGANWYQTQSGSFRDIEINPGNSSIIYASGGSFYRSNDSGESFSQISNGVPASDSRMAIGVSPAQGDYVYVLVGNNGSGFVGMYRSTDGGLTFTEQATSPNLLGWATDGSDSGGQAWYDLSITVDPSDADAVYTGGVNVWKSADGGVTWSLNGHWYGGGGAPYVHADVHSLDFHNGELYVGCDGGVFHTADGGGSYTDKSSNLEIAQMYKLGTSQTQANLVLTGWQDNGTNLKNGTNWSRVIGGDGMECLIDYSDASVRFGELYYGNIRRSTGGGYSTWVSSGGSGLNSNGNWVTPFIQDPNDPDVFYVGKDSLYKTTDDGATWVGLFEPTGSNIDEIAACPSNSDYVYCSVDNDIFLTTDGGLTYAEITNNLPNNYITYIAVSDTDENKVWVSYSGFSSANKVWKSEDGGQTWTNESNGLPNVPVNCIVYQNGSNDAVYCGTDVGVFFRNSTYSTWQPFTSGMPSIVIAELEVNYLTNTLYAATYGRGLWSSDLFSSLNLDAGIGEVVYPVGAECTDEITTQVSVQNFGNSNLTSCIVNYSFDGGTLNSLPWTGNLSVGQSEVILLPMETFDEGPHDLEVYTSAPNGGLDEFPSNDLRTQSFSIADQELLVRIITDRWGAETTWEIYDETSIKVAGGGPYVTTQSSGEYPQPDETICIPSGCFDFIIYDSYGDGMCCGYGNGSFAVTTLNGDTLLSGGSGWSDSDTTAYCPPACEGDMDGDFDVDIDDFLAINSAYGQTCSSCPEDIDGNGLVNIDDFLSLNSAFGGGCNQASGLMNQSPDLVSQIRSMGNLRLDPELEKDLLALFPDFGIRVYPNPNDGEELFISLSSLETETEVLIELKNALGQTVVTYRSIGQSKTPLRIALDTDLSPGIYSVICRYEERVSAAKVVIE